MNEFVSWCRHLLVSFLFHALTSLYLVYMYLDQDGELSPEPGIRDECTPSLSLHTIVVGHTHTIGCHGNHTPMTIIPDITGAHTVY